MNSLQRKTLVRVFAVPIPASLAWADVESLLVGVGCTVLEGSGSRVSFAFNGHIESFHRPHPTKEAKRYQVRQAQEFLERVGIKT